VQRLSVIIATFQEKVAAVMHVMETIKQIMYVVAGPGGRAVYMSHLNCSSAH
jgi:hypothetical protein